MLVYFCVQQVGASSQTGPEQRDEAARKQKEMRMRRLADAKEAKQREEEEKRLALEEKGRRAEERRLVWIKAP